MPNMGSCVGKSYPEIWQMFLDAHIGEARMTESELRSIHLKWKRIATEVNIIPYKPRIYDV